MSDITPFGMLFEEQASHSINSNPQVKYDLELSLSVVSNNGEAVPFVEETWNMVGTQTFTKIRSEGTDDDRESLALMGTKTISEVRQEPTDSDRSDYFLFITQTFTRIRTEETDSD